MLLMLSVPAYSRPAVPGNPGKPSVSQVKKAFSARGKICRWIQTTKGKECKELKHAVSSVR
jgi:hypothetical protein